MSSTTPAESVGDGAPRAAAQAHAAPTSRLMVLLFSDIVGSTELKGRLGTVEYAELLSRHDQIFRQIIDSTPGAHILKDTGDGFFASFATASDAVRAALRFQHGLTRRAAPLQARVGLHLGEVAELELETTGLPKLVGLAADFAARLMGLASGGQILMTRQTFNDARQFVRAHPGVEGDGAVPELRWVAHGEYLIQGADEPVEVFEVGAVGVAPLAPPQDTTKARRNVRPGDEVTLGWRPGSGLAMRGRPNWIIRQKLGEGGFGEVWLAEHTKTGTRRVFKFCFEPARLRGLKREVVLFRLLREALGDRRDIARIIDFQFDESPYFIETEFFPAGTLIDWAESRGGVAAVPPAERIEVVAKVAEALAAAHGVGVLHKDLKPSNILMRDDGQGFYPCITDFGIGILTDRSQLEKHDITQVGFTQSELTDNESSRTGTRLYAPPESLLNKPFTVQGDVYALGVLLFQMVVGDPNRPLAEGWERDVADELLREDIAACVEGNPERRLKSAAELATRLTRWSQRRAERTQAQQAARAATRRQRLVKLMAVLLIVLLGVAAALGVSLVERHRRVVAERSKMETERLLRAEAVLEMQKTAAVTDFLREMLTSVDPAQTNNPDLKVREVLDRAAARIDDGKVQVQPQVETVIRGAIGRTYITLGLFPAAEKNLARAVELARASGALADRAALKAYSDLAVANFYQARYDKAEQMHKDVLERRRTALGEGHEDVAESLYNLSLLYGETRQFDKADDFGKRALAIREKVFGPESKEVAASLQYLARYRSLAGDFASAEPMYLRSLALREKILGADHFEVGSSHNNLGTFYIDSGKVDKAAEHYEKGLAILRKALGDDHPHVAMAMGNVANVYVRRQQYDEALPLLEHALRITERSKGRDHPDLIYAIYGIGTVHYAKNDYAEAIRWYQRARELGATKVGPDAPMTIAATRAIAAVHKDDGKYDLAEPLLRDAMERLRKTNIHHEAMNTEVALVECMVLARKFTEAEPMAIDLHKRAVAFPDAQHRQTFTTQSLQLLAKLYEDWGKPDQAEPWKQELAATSQPSTAATAP